jgi:SAM-dependent methyltransferase
VKVVPAAVFFEAIARRYDRAYALGSAVTKERMARVVGALPPAPASVLDLGVGTGRELGALQDAGYVPTGVDASEAMLAICARRARPVALERADLWGRLPFADASYDACVALHGTLAHPPSRDAYAELAREVARVLRPGGAFVAEMPSRAWLARIEVVPSETGRIAKTSEDTCVHEDDALGFAVEVVVPSDDAWRTVLGTYFSVEVTPLGASEILVVGRRR